MGNNRSKEFGNMDKSCTFATVLLIVLASHRAIINKTGWAIVLIQI